MSVNQQPGVLYVRQLPLGPMKNFVYLIGGPDSADVAVIDPAWDVEAIAEAAARDDKRIAAVVLSHHHSDHINGVEPLLNRFDVPVYAQAAEVDFAAVIRGLGDAVHAVKPGDTVSVGTAELHLVHTPGHTPGSQCVLCRGALFSGDTVFVNACGRCDFPGGSAEQMYESLKQVLGALPGETTLYPGHDYGDVPVSSLARERLKNPYFQLGDVSSFVAHRMRPRR